MLNENDHWLLSFYRVSEFSGALFFGRLARSLKSGRVQIDMSKHFADEAQHAWYWTSCIERLGAQPLKLAEAYQDQYVAAAGLPVNLMEVLAVTQVFEKRVVGQYVRHLKAPNVDPVVAETLGRIMDDEQWHITWVRKALRAMEPEFGAENIASTIQRYTEADMAVYQQTMQEHEQRVEALFGKGENAHVA
jgi:bacterioferritin (cytochrome b1)